MKIDLTGDDDTDDEKSNSNNRNKDDTEDRKLSPAELVEIEMYEVVDVEPEVEIVPSFTMSTTAAFPSSAASNDYALAASLATGSQVLPSQKRRRGTPFDCQICLESDLPSFKGYSLQSCKHRFCTDCLTELIQSHLGDKNSATLHIICPRHKCKSKLTRGDIQYILRDNPNLWKDFTEKANLCVLEAEVVDEDSDTRRCPSERCNFIFQFRPGTGAEGRQFDCPMCHTQYCLQCGANDRKVGPAHPLMTCADRFKQLEEEAEERRKFQDWQKENSKADERFQELLKEEESKGLTKPCPKCKAPITKNGGCAHMHCTRCDTHFLWEGPAMPSFQGLR